ncbi:tyrosine-type recombinase/integrase [Streptomyces acidicola]|uniref:tyrosine-type recombinase/integrase n=1 Tax=Streptomyces acidicola TaxID=2596892 RepID=UPI0038240B7A
MRAGLWERAYLSSAPVYWLATRAVWPSTRPGRRLSRDAVAQRLTTHAATARESCPSPADKSNHPHVLRRSCAMILLQSGVDITVIALWLGHAGVRSTDAYVHAGMTIMEKALALTTPVSARPGRFRPTDKILAFLDSLECR